MPAFHASVVTRIGRSTDIRFEGEVVYTMRFSWIFEADGDARQPRASAVTPMTLSSGSIFWLAWHIIGDQGCADGAGFIAQRVGPHTGLNSELRSPRHGLN
jgi:hypothetical protein